MNKALLDHFLTNHLRTRRGDLLIICLFIITLIGGCDDDPSQGTDAGEQQVGGGVTAGMSGGMMSSGEESGGVQAGEGGGQAVGGMTGGSNIAGEMIAGEVIAGSTEGGSRSAGEQLGGEMIGGEQVVDSCQFALTWEPSPQKGVIYLSHFFSSDLIQYRIDGDAPLEAGRLDLGDLPHDTALNGSDDLYAAVFNLSQELRLYRLPIPQVGADLPLPVLYSTVNLSPYTPRFVFFDEARHRVYVLANAPLGEELLEEMHLFGFDISDPQAPAVLTPQPTVMPVSTAMAIEPRSGTLAMVESNTHLLKLYDVSGEMPIPLEGDPLDIRSLYPEDGGQAGFQIRRLRFDPLRGRLFMARSQGIASEVISFSFQSAESKPDGADDCATRFGYADLTPIVDDIEVEVPIERRDHLLDGFVAEPVLGENLVFFVSYAWRNTSVASFVSMMKENDEGILQRQTACGDYGGLGCFYTSYFNGQSSPYNHRTDGGACVNSSRRIFAGVGLEDEENSSLFLFRYDELAGTMTPWLTAEGRNPTTSLYPLNLSCH